MDLFNQRKIPAITKSYIINNTTIINNSESIVSSIIEKLISYSITEAYRRQIDNKITKNCYDYINKIIGNYISASYISHDREDLNIQLMGSILQNSSIERFEKQQGISKTDLINIKLPTHTNSSVSMRINSIESIHEHEDEDENDSEKDEVSDKLNENININQSGTSENKLNLANPNISNVYSSHTQMQLISESHPMFYDNIYFGVNDWSAIDEPVRAKIDRSASTAIKIVKKITPNIFVNESEKKINEQPFSDTKTNFSKVSRGDLESRSIASRGASRANAKKPRAGILEMPMKKIEGLSEYEEDDHITNARVEKEKEWKKREEEKRVKQKTDQEFQQKTSEIVKKQKEYERKNVTCDANGNVVIIRGILFDKSHNDFISPRQEVKDKENICVLAVRTDPASAMPNTVLTTKKDEKPPTNNLNIKESVQIPLKSIINRKQINKDRDDKTQTTSTNALNFIYNDRAPVIPAGSNFDIITPEVGVTILEGNKTKTGGKDFFRAFKKYSKYDYTLLLKDTGHNVTSSSMGNIPFDYSMDKTNYQMSSLPPINNRTSQHNNEDNINNNNKNTQSNGIIKINTKYGHSLKSALDGLDLIPEFEENIPEDKDLNIGDDFMNNSDLFKKKKLDSIIEREMEGYTKSLEEMNKFNFSIINNTQWGTSLANKRRERVINKQPNKPSQKAIEREVGQNIVKTKLPRARQYTYVTPEAMMNSTTNSFNNTAKSGFSAARGKKFNQTMKDFKKN